MLAGVLLGRWWDWDDDNRAVDTGEFPPATESSAVLDGSLGGGAVPTVAEPATTTAQQKSVRLPDVVGLDLETARLVLVDSGIRSIRSEYTAHEHVAPGTVIMQRPRAGAEITPDTAVTLTIADPPAPVARQEPEVHPQVQAQAMEIVGAIADEHSDEWRWIVPAMERAQLSFFEDLPDSCASAIGCYNHSTGEVWLSLDALRKEPGPFDRSSSRDIVLHELAHAFTRATSAGQALEHQFSRHYAGCRLDRLDLDTDRLAAELLADTMAFAAVQSLKDPQSLGLGRLFGTEGRGYGYFTSDGFDGCLADSEQPDPSLMMDVYTALFDCMSDHALDVFEANEVLVFNPSFDEKAVLRTCYGVECDDRSNCNGWSENDARQTAARDAIRDRTCSDGIVGSGFLEEAGWESFCGMAYVPTDVECVVDRYGREPDPDHRGSLFPGRIGADGTCERL